MDSALLNAYHDETYEATYGHFESSVPDLWSTADIGIGSMELSETLDGILPIAATETEHHDNCIIYDDNQIYDDEEFIPSLNENALVYNDFAQQQIKAEERVGTIDNDVYGNDMIHSNSRMLHVVTDQMIEDDDADAVSQCSEFSFRTRTDSSSIGDYESHSSDYDDDDESEDQVEDDAFKIENENELKLKLKKDDVLTDSPEFNLLNTDDFMFINDCKKQRTISTNTIGSDVDPADFDLAEFITSDDVPAKKEDICLGQSFIKPDNVQLISSKLNESDSDSDIIVDVETVETEETKERALLLKNAAALQMPEDNLTYVDNVKEDPSWSPKESKARQSLNKKQNDVLKNSKGINLKCTSSAKNSSKAIAGKSTTTTKATPLNIQNRGIGKSGKNLSLLKRDCGRIEKNCSQKTRIKEKDIAQLDHDSHRIDPRTQQKVTIIKKEKTEKRKLNLEEYKRRHGEDFSSNSIKKSIQTNQITPQQIQTVVKITQQQSPIKAKTTTTTPHSEAVTSIVKSLKEEQQIKNINQKIDPITQAKMKVLRMQELKKAQQMKIIDSTISAKVPRVTKLLPLQELIKDTAYAIKEDKKQIEFKPQLQENKNYVKIVMVSAACNTTLSFIPSDILQNVPLLDNITRVTENVRVSKNSLITSIQDAIVKQSMPKMRSTTVATTTASTLNPSKLLADISCVQHGENKIIMHLRKDRIRGPTRSIEIQTDFLAAFPILPKVYKFSKLKTKKNHREYRNKNSSIATSSASSSSSDSSGSEGDDCVHEKCTDIEYASTTTTATTKHYQNSEASTSIGGYSSRSSCRHRSSVSPSNSESVHQSRQGRLSTYRKSARKHTRSASSSSSSLSEYSDCSQSRSRSRNRSPYYRDSGTRNQYRRKRGDPNVSRPDVEQRRIVYVGRIEEETSKEMIRRKFIVYGPIKQITFHYKDNGMKYGFVTFERSQDAFSVIDNSTTDSQINMYDISFGGRRIFCRTSYADLDNAGINNYLSYVFPKAVAPPNPDDSFEALLQKVKAKLDANKSSNKNKI